MVSRDEEIPVSIQHPTVLTTDPGRTGSEGNKPLSPSLHFSFAQQPSLGS